MSGVDEKLICSAWMVYVMDEGGKESGKDFQTCEDTNESFRVEHVVGG